MPVIAISTWALHKTIGVSYPDSPAGGRTSKMIHSKRTTELVDLPGEVRKNGYSRVELCHFHIPSREAEYTLKLKNAFRHAGVKLQTLLIDDGDITHPQNGARDTEWIKGWIDTAAQLGAEAVRVIAGDETWSEESANLAEQNLKSIIDHAKGLGVKVRIENWHELLSKPGQVLELLTRVGEGLGLCIDFGNWSGPSKYADLSLIASKAETAHAKADFIDASTLDEADYQKCIDLVVAHGFNGPYVIVNGGKGDDEWEAIFQQAEFIQSALM